MILVYDNYIRVRSARELRHDNSSSDQRIYKAGGGVGMPGATSLPFGWSNPLGVLPPNSFYSIDLPGGEGMKGSPVRNWTASAGIGQGGVEGPSATPLGPHDDHQPIPSLYFDHKIVDNSKVVSSRARASIPGTGINEMMPGDIYRSGSMHSSDSPLLQPGNGSVGRDINALARSRAHARYPKKVRGF